MTLQGVLLIDKPQGPTSFDVIRKLRKLCDIRRIGHAGTLDPEASGLLVVCLGVYTKLCGYLTESSKVYEATIELGVQTNTDDREGEIIARKSIEHINTEYIESACTKFRGVIQQIPPKYSAIRINGQRAYKMARAQEEFSLASRAIEIFSLEVLAVELPNVNIRVHCSKGTYIRALARDIGDFVQVGAHARDIRRVASGCFDISRAMKFDDLNIDSLNKYCLKGHASLGGLSCFSLSDTECEDVKHGRVVRLNPDVKSEVAIAMFKDSPVAVMRNMNGSWRILRVI